MLPFSFHLNLCLDETHSLISEFSCSISERCTIERKFSWPIYRFMSFRMHNFRNSIKSINVIEYHTQVVFMLHLTMIVGTYRG